MGSSRRKLSTAGWLRVSRRWLQNYVPIRKQNLKRTEKRRLITQIINIPEAGPVVAVWRPQGLFNLFLPGQFHLVDVGPRKDAARRPDFLLRLEKHLKAYFGGRAVDFSGIPVDFEGYTAFQFEVLSFVRRLPHGLVTTYGAVAEKINHPGAARAVGQALRRNRTPLVIPCHRVLGKHSLGGFSAGLRWKERLLILEGVFDSKQVTAETDG